MGRHPGSRVEGRETTERYAAWNWGRDADNVVERFSETKAFGLQLGNLDSQLRGVFRAAF